MSSEIEDLHEALFGFRPKKQGTAYERLTAIVLATRGWVDVTHDTTPTLPGKLAGHQLDVTGRLPSGVIERLIVECKHKGTSDVGQDILDHLVGVVAQVGADAAAVITTRGFTTGAIAPWGKGARRATSLELPGPSPRNLGHSLVSGFLQPRLDTACPTTSFHFVRRPRSALRPRPGPRPRPQSMGRLR